MALVGTEAIYVAGVQPNGSPSSVPESTTTQAIAATQTGGENALFTTVATNTPLTLAASAVAGAPDVTILLSAVLAGAGAVTLPTVAAIAALLPNPSAATSYKLRIINASSGAFAWTVTTATGWTLSGTMTVAQDTFRDFVVDFTSATAATLYSAGTGTYS